MVSLKSSIKEKIWGRNSSAYESVLLNIAYQMSNFCMFSSTHPHDWSIIFMDKFDLEWNLILVEIVVRGFAYLGTSITTFGKSEASTSSFSFKNLMAIP